MMFVFKVKDRKMLKEKETQLDFNCLNCSNAKRRKFKGSCGC